MAAFIRLPAMTLAILTVLASVAFTASHGGSVGGATKIPDLKTNKEVQDLGRFSVDEHNRMLRQEQKKGEELTFVEVVEAQQQVVSGIKYSMKISATHAAGDSKLFDSVVVVQPWRHSKQLLNFDPSAQ